MDKRNYKYDKIAGIPSEDVPDIVIECPSNDKLPYTDEGMAECNENGDRLGNMKEIDKDDGVRRGFNRRNSISLPNLENIKTYDINKVSVGFSSCCGIIQTIVILKITFVTRYSRL